MQEGWLKLRRNAASELRGAVTPSVMSTYFV